MHVELETMPGKRSYFPQVMLGVRLEGTRKGRHLMEGFGFFFFPAYMTTTSTILSKVKQNSVFI